MHTIFEFVPSLFEIRTAWVTWLRQPLTADCGKKRVYEKDISILGTLLCSYSFLTDWSGEELPSLINLISRHIFTVLTFFSFRPLAWFPLVLISLAVNHSGRLLPRWRIEPTNLDVNSSSEPFSIFHQIGGLFYKLVYCACVPTISLPPVVICHNHSKSDGLRVQSVVASAISYISWASDSIKTDFRS